MKFLIDAQLSRRLCKWLREAGHDVATPLTVYFGRNMNMPL